MELIEKHYDVGVITGRFQVPELHDAHRDLIETVLSRHKRVIIFLGISPAVLSRSNPLDYESRVQMISQEFEDDITFLPIYDKASDKVWSDELDKSLDGVVHPGQSVVIYGSRDSFISHYSGKYTTQELDAWNASTSGTDVRRDVARSRTRASNDFRAGMIFATTNRYDICFPTVDIAVISNGNLLLGRKPGEKLFRFPGGFVDPTDPSLEAACRREVREETGLEIMDPVYLCSALVKDWRYRQKDKILTSFFVATKQFGQEKAGDDLEEVKWFCLGTKEPKEAHTYTKVVASQMVESHRLLLAALLSALDKGKFT